MKAGILARLVACFSLASASAVALDPTVALRLASAPSKSPAATPRLDPNGTNQTSALLPESPSLVWQTRLTPPLVGELAADERGRLLVAHGSDRVTLLDAAGHTAWSLRLGTELALGPLPVAGGRILLITRDATVLRLSASGTLEGRETLAWGSIEQTPIVTSTLDGGAIIASGSALARLGPRGTRGYETHVSEPVRAVFDWQGETVAVSHAGTVFTRGSAGDPVRLGSLEAPVREVALVGRQLLGIGKNELLTFDLVSHERRVVFSDPSVELRDLATLAAGRVRLMAAGASLVDLDASGRELSRQRLPLAEGGGELVRIVTDRTGRTLLGTTGSGLVQVTPEGDTATLPDTSCLDPLRPTPVANARFVVACRSGLLRAFSDRAR